MVDERSLREMRERVDEVRGRIARAAARSGRSADDVTLVAVSKFQPVEAIYTALACGLSVFGENRVQERAAKSEIWSPPAWAGDTVPEWHMIGRLQSNKARRAAELFDCVESVASFEIASMINKKIAKTGNSCYPILIEVNTSGEDSKDGVSPEELPAILDAVLIGCSSLSVEGLMTIGPLTDDEGAIRRSFAELRGLAEVARARTGAPLPHLSMGMTGDFEWAIEEGSTIVRVGTGIFGSRARA